MNFLGFHTASAAPSAIPSGEARLIHQLHWEQALRPALPGTLPLDAARRSDARAARAAHGAAGDHYWRTLLRGSRTDGLGALQALWPGTFLVEDELIPDADPHAPAWAQTRPMRPEALMLAARGEHLSGTRRVRLQPMTLKRCHANVAQLYAAQDIDCIVTGYALTAATGLWVRHTWGRRGRQIIETTLRYDQYLGLTLDNTDDVDAPNGSAVLFSRQFL